MIIQINQKYKNNSEIHITIGNILYNIIKIISEDNTKDRIDIKNLGKNYLDIIANMLKNELKISNCVILTEDFNKIIEYTVKSMNQNELEQIFQGIKNLFDYFETKRINLIKKKNKKENEKEEKKENKKEDEESLSSLDEEEEYEEEDLINYLNKNILELEQIS